MYYFLTWPAFCHALINEVWLMIWKCVTVPTNVNWTLIRCTRRACKSSAIVSTTNSRCKRLVVLLSEISHLELLHRTRVRRIAYLWQRPLRANDRRVRAAKQLSMKTIEQYDWEFRVRSQPAVYHHRAVASIQKLQSRRLSCLTLPNHRQTDLTIQRNSPTLRAHCFLHVI